MIKRNLVYYARDSRGRDCVLIFETEKTHCSDCGTGMQEFTPIVKRDFTVGMLVNGILICGRCQATIEQQSIQVFNPSSPEVDIATVKAIASDIFLEEEFNTINWRDFVPHRITKDSAGMPIIIAQGASLHKSVKLTGPVVIDKHSTIDAKTMLGPYTGIIHSKIGQGVVLEECRVFNSYVDGPNHLKRYLLKETVIPGGRFR